MKVMKLSSSSSSLLLLKEKSREPGFCQRRSKTLANKLFFKTLQINTIILPSLWPQNLLFFKKLSKDQIEKNSILVIYFKKFVLEYLLYHLNIYNLQHYPCTSIC